MLARYRADDDAAVLAEQWTKLEALQAWCRAAGKPLVLEVLVARKHEPEDGLRSVGTSGDARRIHRRGLPPRADAGVLEDRRHARRAEGARTIDAAIAAHPACRQIILGKAADLSTIDRWFAACAASATASGFAIGRSVFWEPSAAFLTGTMTADDAAAADLRHIPEARRRLGTLAHRI